MKSKILLFLFIGILSLNAYVVSDEVKAEDDAKTSQEITDYNIKIHQEEQKVQEEYRKNMKKVYTEEKVKKEKELKKKERKALQQQLRDTKLKKKQFFVKEKREVCRNLLDLKCPPLLGTWSNLDVMVDYVSPMTGEVRCSVVNLNKELGLDTGLLAKYTSPDLTNKLGMKVIFSKTFTNKACVEKFSAAENTPRMGDANFEEVKKTRKELALRQAELKETMDKYDEDYKNVGGKTYLDLADWLDALSTIDGEKINIKKTLSEWEVVMDDKFTLEPNVLLLNKFQSNIESIMKYYNSNVSDADIDKEIDDRIRFDEKNKLVSNSQYVMYLDFFITSNDSVNEALHIIMGLFMGWNIIVGWIFNGVTKKMSSGDSGQDHWNKGIFGVATFIALFGGNIDDYKIVANSGDTVKQLEFKTTRMQTMVRGIYSQANDLSDAIAKNAIASYLHSLDATSGVATVDSYDSFATEKKQLLLEKDMLSEANEQCMNNYDVVGLKNILNGWRTKSLSHSSGTVRDDGGFNSSKGVINSVFNTDVFSKDVNELDINPYPKSEREIFAASIDNSDKEKKLRFHPYATIKNHGFANNNLYDKIKQKNKRLFFMSMSGCNNIRNKMFSNRNRIDYITKKMHDIGDSETHQKTVRHLKVVHDMMWKNYAELGYISIAFLPATSLLIDNQGVLGNGAQRKADMENATDQGGSGFMKYTFKALPMMALFGGGNIANSFYDFGAATLNTAGSVVAHVASFNPLGKMASLVSEVHNFLGGEDTSKNSFGVLISYCVANQAINTILESTLFVVLITVSIVQFVLLSLNKLMTFFSTMFLVIFTFSENAQQQLVTAFGKIIATAFKSVLLVISIFLAIYAMSLIDSLEAILINGFFDNMGTINHISDGDGISEMLNNFFNYLDENTLKYTFYGVSHLGMAIVKIYLVINIITKYPSYFYDLIGAKVNDVGEDIIHSVQQANEQQNMKGIH